MCKRYEIGHKISIMVDGEEKYLTFLGMSNEFIPSGNRKGKWLCYCGKEFNCTNHKIKIGHTTSCGHLRKTYDIGEKILVKINNEEKYLIYLGFSEIRNNETGILEGRWECYCGDEFNCQNHKITNGSVKCCPNDSIQYKINDIIKVEVSKQERELKYLGDTGRKIKGHMIGEWLCFCGDKFECLNINITSGGRKSCGKWCWVKSYKEYSKTDLIHCRECNKFYTKDNFQWRDNYLCRYLCDICRKSQRKLIEDTPEEVIRRVVSGSVYKALKRKNSKKTKPTFKALGYTPENLKNYLEVLFEPWMTWNNYGVYHKNTWKDSDQSTWKWQLDHIKPHSDFHYTSMEDQSFKDCWSLSNLRPYPAKQNLLDGVNRTRHKKV